jgi:hypothetical protein
MQARRRACPTKSYAIEALYFGDVLTPHPGVKIILTHFTEGETDNLIAEEIRSVQNVVLAKDGMKIDLIPS